MTKEHSIEKTHFLLGIMVDASERGRESMRETMRERERERERERDDDDDDDDERERKR